MQITELFSFGLAVLVVIFLVSGVRIVPQQRAYIDEGLGKFYPTAQAGMTYVVPFLDSVAYKLSLKEMAIDIPQQVKILRYEVKNINPPKTVLEAMEKQMRAERGPVLYDRHCNEHSEAGRPA